MGFIDHFYRRPEECRVWLTSLRAFRPRNYFCHWRDKPGVKWLTVNCRIKSDIQVTLLGVGSLSLSCCLQKEEKDILASWENIAHNIWWVLLFFSFFKKALWFEEDFEILLDMSKFLLYFIIIYCTINGYT